MECHQQETDATNGPCALRDCTQLALCMNNSFILYMNKNVGKKIVACMVHRTEAGLASGKCFSSTPLVLVWCILVLKQPDVAKQLADQPTHHCLMPLE